MPSGIASGTLITSSLRLLGAIAPGETPTANEINDGLGSLNDLLEILSTQNLAVYGAQTESFPTVPGQFLYTIGPGGNWNTTRPVRISGDGICTFSGVDFSVEQIGQAEYDQISLKTLQEPISKWFLYVNENPLGKIFLWPVPSQTVTITLDTDRILTSIADTTITMNFPPGYLLMFKYQLALLLATDYGVALSPETLAIAVSSLATLKRANQKKSRASFDDALMGPGVSIWQTG